MTRDMVGRMRAAAASRFAPASAKRRDGWRDQAACAGLGDVMFPETQGGVWEARLICADCPVRFACLYESLYPTSIPHGIWAGTTPQQRTLLRGLQKQLGDHDRFPSKPLLAEIERVARRIGPEEPRGTDPNIRPFGGGLRALCRQFGVRYSIDGHAAEQAVQRMQVTGYVTRTMADRWCALLGTHLSLLYPEAA